jgi:hypothetical protein
VFLKHLGIKRRKVGMIPAKADTEKQAQFKQAELEPRLAEAQAGLRAVFFMDAAHFVLSPFLGYLWSRVRIFIQAPSGRQRFNVLGAHGRHHPRGLHRHQPDLHHFGAGL